MVRRGGDDKDEAKEGAVREREGEGEIGEGAVKGKKQRPEKDKIGHGSRVKGEERQTKKI